MKSVVFGNGCFWCTEAVFKMLKGVTKVEPGYAGGHVTNPTYAEVSAGTTGHAEVIRLEYDPSLVSYEDLITVFFGSHDPTTPNRQGNDIGEQYRSIIFYADEEEKATAERLITEVNESLKDGTRVVTQLLPETVFYPAEDYHTNYYENHKAAPYCMLVIESKVEKVRKRFAELVNPEASV